MLLAPDLGYGGAERSFASLTHLLSNRYNVFAVVFNEEIKQVYSIHGKLISLNVRSRHSLFGKLYNIIQRTSRLKSLKRELNISVCISFLEGADYINVLSKGKERVILSIRGSKRYDKNITGVLGFIRKKLLLRSVYKNANAVVSVSKGLQNELVEDYKIEADRADTIYNYYNLPEMEGKSAKPVNENLSKLLKENKCLATVGRLSPEKGFLQLLQVFARIVKKDKSLKLIFIGEGDLITELKKNCTEADLPWQDYDPKTDLDFKNAVFFMGYQPEPLSIISKSFLFLLPSLTEGFPNALIEAMAAGVPVIAANCPHGTKEIIGNSQSSNGLLLPHFFEYANPANQSLYDQWASAITTLISDPERRQTYVRSARIRVQDFTEAEALKKWSMWIDQADNAKR